MKISILECLFINIAVISSCSGMDVNTPIEVLDQKIYEELCDPSGTLGRGDLLLKEMIAYYGKLLDVFNFLKFKDNKGIDLVDLLEKDGGPKVVNMEKVNGDEIKSTYKWQDNDLEVVTTMIATIKALWRRITDKVYHFSSDLYIPHREGTPPTSPPEYQFNNNNY